MKNTNNGNIPAPSIQNNQAQYRHKDHFYYATHFKLRLQHARVLLSMLKFVREPWFEKSLKYSQNISVS